MYNSTCALFEEFPPTLFAPSKVGRNECCLEKECLLCSIDVLSVVAQSEIVKTHNAL